MVTLVMALALYKTVLELVALLFILLVELHTAEAPVAQAVQVDSAARAVVLAEVEVVLVDTQLKVAPKLVAVKEVIPLQMLLLAQV
jgi:hypothetical protein